MKMADLAQRLRQHHLRQPLLDLLIRWHADRSLASVSLDGTRVPDTTRLAGLRFVGFVAHAEIVPPLFLAQLP